MRRACGAALILIMLALATTNARASNWPTNVTFDNGNELGVTGIFQYDWNTFTNDRLVNGTHLFDDAHDWRRREVNVYLKNKHAFKITAGYDFAADAWVDNYVAVHTGVGKFQIGEFRTAVGWEAAQASGAATTMLEVALPLAVTYEGRRAGIGWTYTGMDHWTLQAQWFGPHDLNHNANGNTLAARVVYAPVASKTDVVHLGIASSREQRDDHTARFKTTPEAALTPVTLVDTGLLHDVDHIHRTGLEMGWMHGPLLLQGEYLQLRAQRSIAEDFNAHGGYLLASWVLTGEAHAYKNTAFGVPEPTHAWGALELAARYSRVDLDDPGVLGGVQHDWTIGINWYLGNHFRVQANAIHAVTESGNIPVDPHVYELRVQLMF